MGVNFCWGVDRLKVHAKKTSKKNRKKNTIIFMGEIREVGDILNKSNDRSMYNRLPVHWREALDLVPAEYFDMSPDELDGVVSPSRTLNMLRFRLWDEFDRIADESVQLLESGKLIRGICTAGYLKRSILSNAYVMAWLMCAPFDYMESAKESLTYGVSRLREMLELPLLRDNGRPDINVARLQLSVVKMLDARVMGKPLETKKGFNLNLDVKGNQVREIMELESMDEIDRALKKVRGVEGREVLKDVTPDALSVPVQVDGEPEF